MARKSKIEITVELDDNNHPSEITWEAEEGAEGIQNAKAMLLAMFDKTSLDTVKIDLWTDKMKVNEMDKFFYQTFRSLCDTYYRSTNNTEIANDMRNFTEYFGQKTGCVSKPKTS